VLSNGGIHPASLARELEAAHPVEIEHGAADAAARVRAEPLPACRFRLVDLGGQRVRLVADPVQECLEPWRTPIQVSNPVQPIEIVHGLGYLAAGEVAHVGEQPLVHVQRVRPLGHRLLDARRQRITENLHDGHQLDQLVTLGL
jgi:hypothetical protein